MNDIRGGNNFRLLFLLKWRLSPYINGIYIDKWHVFFVD
ncbi:hypothetical protein GTCCBUS3UF5_5980 [Geobacillus thermoleovorans CCB_US3_UF5]|uniref:Uncharacterized protein n=1 Tax=Geobacillus thermoleovorans CCB_US3_UF5 TaxID=1111068 RepID=A0ABN3ZR39_GEOTH|nr:hypothetical protein GTCCBUS3UF5_5980 [Geobacillus thermoleovorans CCB_US3_UF5]GAJ60558.1 hypothetical protein B23_3803 [Geobacillus thermoleovorans B23]